MSESLLEQPNSVSDEPQQASPRLSYRARVVTAVLLAVVLRARFFFSPISPDEGGYIAIARKWRHGATLYNDIWIDRPQGLISIYRAFDILGGTSHTVRVLSLIAAVMTVVGIAELVRAVANPTAGVVAAVLAALVCTAPALDGFAANGELLGGAFGALALGVAARVLTKRSNTWWMVAAGALAGVALSIKQSSADGLGTLLVWLVLAAVFGLISRREAVAHLWRCALGAGVVIGSLLLHGGLTGWDRWYYAILGYRLSQRSALQNANWDRMKLTSHDVLPIIEPVIIVSILAAVLLLTWRRQRTVQGNSLQLLLPIWAVLSVLMFLSGGQFFHHYWLTLTYPLAAIGGLAIGGLGLVWWRRGLLVAAVASAALSWVSFATTSREEIWPKISGEHRPLIAQQLGHWLPTVMQPGDTLFAMCTMPSLYAVADKDPVYPYMWWDSVHNPTGAQQAMIDLFTGPTPPTWVPLVFSTKSCNPSGIVTEAFSARYHLVATKYGIEIYHLNEGPG
ncbi:MAG: glycosyltransferase family 39 protein [Actinomycetota bacterium]